MKPILAILAGGRSRRMGAAKPTLRLGGEPLISYPFAAARDAGLEPWVVAKRGSELPPLECRLLVEPAQPRHPLCGIVAALRAAAPAPVTAVAADMPFVEPELLAWLAAQDSTVAVEAEGRLQPLLAHYAAEALEPLERALADGDSATSVLGRLQPQLLREDELRRFGDPALLCFNVNTPDDLTRAEEILSSRLPGR